MKNSKLILKSGFHFLSATALLLLACHAAAEPAGSAFTYQGRLNDGGIPANGSYEMTFTLYDAVSNGVPVSVVITNSTVLVNNGLFDVALDFGTTAFTGEARWLEIGVRTNGALDAFATLSPRQALTPIPYALQAGSAASATSVLATNITGTIPDSQLSTNIARLDGAANFTGTITAQQFVGSGAGLTNLSDVVHPADFSAPSWTFDKTYTYRANEIPWDYARDGFILMTAYPYSMDFTNRLQITNGYVTIFPRPDTNSPSGFTNEPPFYLTVTNRQAIQNVEADIVVTTNGATSSAGYIRQLILALTDQSPIGTGGTNYTLANMNAIHAIFRSSYVGGVLIDLRLYTNGVGHEYTNELAYGRSGILTVAVPYSFRPGDVVKCSIGWANDDTLIAQLGPIIVPWRLDRFRLLSANTHYAWLESYDQFQTNFNTMMAFRGLRYSVDRQHMLPPGLEVSYTNQLTGISQAINVEDIQDSILQFRNPVRFTNDTRPTWNGVGLATTEDVGNTSEYQMAADAISAGLTTSIEVPNSGGGTNTLYFTNGILRSVQ